jgi:hypothetical protein
MLGEAARERRLARIAKATGLNLSGRHRYACNPYSDEGHCLCEAPQGHLVHTGFQAGALIPDRSRQVTKSSSWSPGMTNRATEQWLVAHRRG